MTTATEHGRQGSPEELIAPQGFWAELRDAVSLRTVSLIGGVLLLQFAFILSYVAAFHAPKPHEIRLGIVSPSEKISEQTADKMNAIDSHPLNAVPVADKDTAIQQIKSGELSAALVINIFGKTDTLLISSGGGATVANAVTKVVTLLVATQHRTVNVEDVVPLQSGDNYGLTGFYLCHRLDRRRISDGFSAGRLGRRASRDTATRLLPAGRHRALRDHLRFRRRLHR